MPRPSGHRNADYEATRAALLTRLHDALLKADGVRLSFRQMSDAAGVSSTTLRHYFQSREQVIAEVLALSHRAGLPYLHAAATQPTPALRPSLHWFLDYVVQGWRAGVGAVHGLGLTEGIGHSALGPAYVTEILEPSLQAAETRLARHVAAGELAPCDVRQAAIALLGPLLVALLHQDSLGGTRCRPLDLDAFCREHIKRFVRAFAPPRAGSKGTTASEA
jgi:AcrR family transcriptional regulator